MQPVTPDRDVVTFRQVMATLGRAKLTIIGCVAVAVAAVVVFSFTRPAEYEAKAEVYLSSQNISALVTGTQAISSNSDPDRIIRTQAELARVPQIAEGVLKAIPVPGRTPNDFLEASSVEPRTKSDLLVFAVRDGEPEVAASLATEYAREFIDYRRQLDTASIARARQGVDRQLEVLRTRGESSSSLYAELFAKAQELATLETVQTSNAFLVHEAESADKISPRPVRDGIVALIAALAIAVGVVLLWEILDTRVRSADEIEEALGGVPLLARLPRSRAKRKASAVPVMLSAPTSPEAEPYRMLRTSLEYATMGRGLGAILVTSAVPDEGKSTTASNLAVALAYSGKHVCLVDMDTRNPSLHRFFGVAPIPGLTNVIINHQDIRDAMHEIEIHQEDLAGGVFGTDPGIRRGAGSGLWVLSAGTSPPSPGEFVSTPEVTDVVADLREHFEVVIIDAPPILPVVEAKVLSQLVSGILVVARPSLLRRNTLAELRRALGECRAPVIGFVTTAEESHGAYGASSYYGYGTPATSPAQTGPAGRER